MDRQIPIDISTQEAKSAGARPPPPECPDSPLRKRRSWFRHTLGGVAWLSATPADWFGRRRISGGATLIGQLYQGVRAGWRRDLRIKTGDDRTFDLVGTAFAYGISVERLERRLAARRRQTAALAYTMFALACILVLAWAWVALRVANHGGRVALLLQFLPFCALFYLKSFHQALLNFQIRTGRAAGWREYLSTDEGFLPQW
jgi:hypothetical protein